MPDNKTPITTFTQPPVYSPYSETPPPTYSNPTMTQTVPPKLPKTYSPLPPNYSVPDIVKVYKPQPLTPNEQFNLAEQKFHQEINPTLEAMHAYKSPDSSFATIDQEAQQYLAQAINPVNTARHTLNEASKFGLKAYTVTHPAQTINLIHNLIGAHPAAAAAIGAGALLFAEPLHNKLQEYEWQIQSLSHPAAALEHKITGKLQNTLLRGTLPVLSKPLIALGYSLGLLDTTEMPHAFYPSISVSTPVFKPTRWLHQKPAELLEKWAGKTKSVVVKNGLQRYSHSLRARKHRSFLQWFFYPVILAGELGTELLFSYIESRAPQLASLLRGYSVPISRGLFSINTGLSAWGGYKLGSQVPLLGPVLGPATGAVTGTLGWYYQSLLNLANNKIAMPAYMLRYENLWSSSAARVELMPVEYAKIFGPRYFDSPAAIEKFINDYGYKISGTQFRGEAGTANYEFLNAKYLSQEGFLGKLFGRPARFLFKYRILQTLPLRGFFLGPILGLPLFGKAHMMLIAGDFALRLLETNPVLNKLKNSALWGAAVGAELGFLTGQNPWLFAASGTALGLSVEGLNLFSTLEAPGYNVGGRLFADPAFKNLVTAENIFNSEGQLVYRSGAVLPSEINFWQTANKAQYLAQAYPQLNNSRLGNNILNFFDRANLNWLTKFRYLKGAWIGELIGVQLFLLTGDPKWLVIGPLAGTTIQLVWEGFLAKAAAITSQYISNAIRFVGQKVLGPVMAGVNIYSALSSWSDYLGKPSLAGLGVTALFTGMGILSLTALGVSAPVAALIILSALLVQAVVQGLFHFSIAGWINTNIFSPVGHWLGKTFGPFFHGVFSLAGEVANAALGFIMGLFQAATSANLQAQAAGWVTAVFSLTSIGSGFLAMVSASGFFSAIPGEMRRLATGFLYLNVDKSFSSVAVNYANQPVAASYQISYSYPQPPKDENGQPLPGNATDLEISDEFVSPRDLKAGDLEVISYLPMTLQQPTKKSNPVRFVFSDIKPAGMAPGETDQLKLSVQFSRPLPELLAEYHSCAICNQAIFSATIPKSSNSTTKADTISQTICLNAQGKVVASPADLVAKNLIAFLDKCYNQSCDPGVSKKDFIPPEDYTSDPENPYTGCPNPDEIQACQQVYEPYYNIQDYALNFIRLDTLDLNNPSGYLRTFAFIQAAEILQDRTFPAFPNPEDYKQLNQPGGYVYHQGTDGAVLGDLVIGKDAYPHGYIVSYDSPGFGISMILNNGNPASNWLLYNSDIIGYLHYGPDTCL